MCIYRGKMCEIHPYVALKRLYIESRLYIDTNNNNYKINNKYVDKYVQTPAFIKVKGNIVI